MLQIAAFLTYLGLGGIATLINASQRERYNTALDNHQRTVTSCQRMIKRSIEQSNKQIAFVQAKAEYRTAVQAGNSAWKFMNESRKDLNHLWDGIKRLEGQIRTASVQNYRQILSTVGALRTAHREMREQLLDLKKRVQELNRSTFLLREKFNQLGPEGVRYQAILAQRRAHAILQAETSIPG